MEYCDEGTLEEVSRLGLQEHVIRLYSKQIAIAINVLHEHGIVHRDIKGNPALASRRAPSSASHAPLRRAPRGAAACSTRQGEAPALSFCLGRRSFPETATVRRPPRPASCVYTAASRAPFSPAKSLVFV